MVFFRITVEAKPGRRRYVLEWSGPGRIDYLTEKVIKLFKGMIDAQTVEIDYRAGHGALELESSQDNWVAIEKKLERMFRKDFGRPVTWMH
jgi:hypothetical protein